MARLQISSLAARLLPGDSRSGDFVVACGAVEYMLDGSPRSMAVKAPAAAAIPRTYAELRRGVEAVLFTGRQQVEAAWVRTYHESGRLIHEHLLHAQTRADYGAKLYARLSADTGVSARSLQECTQFYRCVPMARTFAQLGWRHYQLLCQVGDPARRKELLVQARKQEWTVADLTQRVRALNAAREAETALASGAAPVSATKRLKPRWGTPGLYRVVAREEGLAIDVGFKLYRPFDDAQGKVPRGVKAGAIVRVEEGDVAGAPDATPADLYAYRVTVRRVVDGDTLLVTIALPHYAMDEKLRLRGLDCPEMDTPEGRAAKRFAESLLVDAAEVTIATSKVDKYDRYLADVHIRRASGEAIFLNNALLENGHAIPMGAEEMTDWTP